MHRRMFPGLLVLLLAARADDGDPRAVARTALRAVEGDSAVRVAERWEARLRVAPGDAAATLGLATLDRLQYDYAGAERRYDALRRADTLGAPALARRYAAHAWLGTAQGEHLRGVFAAAAEHYERARRAAVAAGDSTAELQALLGLVVMRARIASPAAGIALLDSVAPRLPKDAELQAAARARRAMLFAQAGRAEAEGEGRACAREALAAGERRIAASCLHTVAIDAERRGAPRVAVQLLDTVAQLYRATRDRSQLAGALQWQGYMLTQIGEYGRARAVLRESVASGTASGNAGAVAWASLSLASIERLTQDRAAAGAALARSVAAFDSLGDQWGAMSARTLGAELAADAGDLRRARQLAEAQLAWGREVHQPRSEWAARLLLAGIAEREGAWAATVAELDSARAVARRYAMAGWENELAYLEGRVALRRGRLDDAARQLEAFRRALPPDDFVGRYRAGARLADVHARRGEPALAARELAAAGDDLDAWRATLADAELRTLAFQLSGEEDADLGVPRVLASLAAAGFVEQAFGLAERRRARELADRLVQAATLTGDRGTDVVLAGVQTRARAAQGSFALQSLAAALPDSTTALVEFVVGVRGAPTTLFVLTRRGGAPSIAARILPPADSLAGQIARFTALVESNAQPASLGRALGAALLDPVVALAGPGVSRLVIVPDGILHRVPFDALQLAGGQYAVERFAVSVAPSAAVVAELWQRRTSGPAGAPPAAPARVLALGDPAFAGERAAGATFRSALLGSVALPRLESSGREARAVARYSPDVSVRLRGEASEAFVKRTPLRDFGVLHFATHALVDEGSATRTAIALSPGDGEDGFLFPGDIAALDLHADLVVLSACRTAGGVLVAGEGVQGLTAPLLQAGARAVVASRWRVGDRSTVALVEDFYDAMAAGQPVGEALLTAKRAALARGAPATEWAAFSVVGDPSVLVALRPARRWPWPLATLLLSLGALAAVAVVAARHRRRTR